MMNKKIISAAVAAAIGLATPVVMHFEGLRTAAYSDPVGIPTICWGHTGAEVKLGQKKSSDACKDLLTADLITANRAIDACVTVPLTANQRGAFASFTFNVGGGKFCRSSLLKKLNAGDTAGACAELSRWVYAGGEKLPGLVRRRAAERALCEQTS
jgi:lysozyme